MNIRTSVKKVIPKKLFQQIEPLGHKSEAILLHSLNAWPFRGLKVIGVTGTNGKTTTAYMIHKILVNCGIKCGLMTTVGFGVGNNIRPQVAHMTSVSVPELIKRVKEMRRQKIEWLVLETTSHALAQNRTWGVPYSIAVMTNLTHEHLDYHGSFEAYRAAKIRLFQMTNANKSGLRLGIVNADDSNAKYFSDAIEKVMSYGLKKGQLIAENIQSTPLGSQFDATINGHKMTFSCPLPGSFNVSNALAAIQVGLALKLDPDQIKSGLANLTAVEGRMTKVDLGQDFGVIVDYAHTPDSFAKLFADLRPLIKGKLIVVFGSAGRRDEAKRAEQGRIAGEYADEIIITEEDDRDMDGQAIMDEIAAGAESVGKIRGRNLFLEHNRRDAIQLAIDRASSGDCVLLLGKGHEKDILRNGPRAAELRHLQQDDHDPQRVIEFPWDEIVEAEKAINKK